MSTPITTAADPLAVIFDAPAVPSQGYGLYNAATLIDTGEVPRELTAGVDIYPFNCDTGFGTFSPDICDDSPEKAPGERGAITHADPMIVWAAAECAPDQSEATELARARQILTLQEPLAVESAFAARILTDAGAAETAATFLEAVGLAEVWLGELGYNGYIHASRKWAALGADHGLLVGSGGKLRTPLGNTWVFGGGYDSALGNSIVATGQVFAWRSTPFERVVTTGSHVTPKYNNTVYALAERSVTVGYECGVHAVTITP